MNAWIGKLKPYRTKNTNETEYIVYAPTEGVRKYTMDSDYDYSVKTKEFPGFDWFVVRSCETLAEAKKFVREEINPNARLRIVRVTTREATTLVHDQKGGSNA